MVVLPDKKDADRFSRELHFFMEEAGQEGRIHEFPPYDLTPLTGLSPHREVPARRVQALYSLMTDEDAVAITCVEAISLRTLPKDALVGAMEYLEVGEEVERASLLRRLEVTGYHRSSLVEELSLIHI